MVRHFTAVILCLPVFMLGCNQSKDSSPVYASTFITSTSTSASAITLVNTPYSGFKGCASGLRNIDETLLGNTSFFQENILPKVPGGSDNLIWSWVGTIANTAVTGQPPIANISKFDLNGFHNEVKIEFRPEGIYNQGLKNGLLAANDPSYLALQAYLYCVDFVTYANFMAKYLPNN